MNNRKKVNSLSEETKMRFLKTSFIFAGFFLVVMALYACMKCIFMVQPYPFSLFIHSYSLYSLSFCKIVLLFVYMFVYTQVLLYQLAKQSQGTDLAFPFRQTVLFGLFYMVILFPPLYFYQKFLLYDRFVWSDQPWLTAVWFWGGCVCILVLFLLYRLSLAPFAFMDRADFRSGLHLSWKATRKPRVFVSCFCTFIFPDLCVSLIYFIFLYFLKRFSATFFERTSFITILIEEGIYSLIFASIFIFSGYYQKRLYNMIRVYKKNLKQS